jgi:hypothetical protein
LCICRAQDGIIVPSQATSTLNFLLLARKNKLVNIPLSNLDFEYYRMVAYEFIYAFTKEVLNLDRSIRWVGVANKYGVLLNTEHREGLHAVMTDEENEEYARLTVTRHKTRVKFEPKTGPLIYALGKYEKLNRVTLHIDIDYFLLITLDVEEKNFDNIVTEKVIPLVNREKGKLKADNELS